MPGLIGDRRRTPSPVLLVLGGIVSVQVGAAFAKGAFEQVAPTTLVWLRLLTSAALLLAIARPPWRGHGAPDWGLAVAFGASLAVMNWAIYQSFARIPLGIAVTIEFLGPLAVALGGSRRARDLAWVVLAALGVVLLGFGPESERADPVTLSGVLFAVLAAAAWAAYIVLAARTGQRFPGVDGLALASAVAALFVTILVWLPLPEPGDAPSGLQALTWSVLGIGLAVGVLSSVVPYALEMRALRTLAPSTFGILMSLEPAAAALAAAILLGELLGATQTVAIGCVVAASIGATRSARGPRAAQHPLPPQV